MYHLMVYCHIMSYWQLELVSGIVSCPEVLPLIQEALPLRDSFLSGGALRQLPEAFCVRSTGGGWIRMMAPYLVASFCKSPALLAGVKSGALLLLTQALLDLLLGPLSHTLVHDSVVTRGAVLD